MVILDFRTRWDYAGLPGSSSGHYIGEHATSSADFPEPAGGFKRK